MRKGRLLSLVMAFLMTSALVLGDSCVCVAGDCHSASSGGKQGNGISCHARFWVQGAAGQTTKAKEPSRKECCGKCQIEKAAVPSQKILNVVTVSSDRALTLPALIFNVPEVNDTVSLRNVDGSSPPSYLIQHIINATFSFRAPPAF